MSYETDIQYRNLFVQVSRAANNPAFLSDIASDDLKTLEQLVDRLHFQIQSELRGKGHRPSRK